MRTELPLCKRCCFCVPLRYGLLTWGYCKLVIAIMVSIAMIVTLYSLVQMAMYYSNNIYVMHHIVVISIVLVVLLIDIALNLVFIVGGHTKNVSLLRVYYIYNIVLWALTIALVLLMGVLMMPTVTPDHLFSYRGWLMLIDFASSFVNIVIQSYFLLLLRSEIVKLRSNCEFRFVNNAAEAECTMNYKEALINGWEKGMQDVCGTCEREAVCAKICQTNGTCHKNEDQD
ncbi:hypothetical protein PYW07_012063 [Mythimna separata]|uniref:Uncharacterized protein n=1 Tax=Mythimna separata TaxID=271217 RepID=A0AAD7YLI1_MYTSE|nr:hypothetical protein PYW07_012063 [Mythimna separata]